jgi:hypothetical protein
MSKNYFTYIVCDARQSVVATDQYEGREQTLESARYYAKALHGASLTVRSPSGRVVARETVSESASVSVTQS